MMTLMLLDAALDLVRLRRVVWAALRDLLLPLRTQAGPALTTAAH